MDQLDQYKQADFIKSFRADNPELSDIPDPILMKHLFEIEPNLKKQIITPDMDAAVAQDKALQNQASNQNFTRAILSSLPAIGGMAGGVISAPSGAGPLVGIPLGIGAGKGLQDLAEQMLGLQDTGPLEKLGSITRATAEGALTNTGLTAVDSFLRNPGITGAAGRATLRATGRLINPRNWPTMLEGAGNEATPPGKIKFNLERPGNYRMGTTPIEEGEKKILGSTGTGTSDKLLPTNPRMNIKVAEEPMKTPSATTTSSKLPEPTGRPVTAERPNTSTSRSFQYTPPTEGPRVRIAENWNPKRVIESGQNQISWTKNAKGEWIIKSIKGGE